MTWRAFIIGLVFVALLGWVEPLASFILPYGPWFTYSSFPVGAAVVLVLLGVFVNLGLRAVRRAWVFSRQELLLVFCMMFVASAIPCEGIGRYFFQMVAGPAYLSRRAEIPWAQEGGALRSAPDGLVLSKSPLDEASRRYYEGGAGRIPWRSWAAPLVHWGAFLIPMYMAVFFLCGILRRQWVEVERLMFPLARVPLEFTEQERPDRPLPDIFYRRGFVAGLIFVFAFRFVTDIPVFWGGTAVQISFPFVEMFRGTALEDLGFPNQALNLAVVGFAFLVPADVSLGVWLFFMFARAEILIGRALALPDLSTPNSQFLRWQQLGTYIAFVGGMIIVARRHLAGVLRAAFGLRGAPDDSGEPISYPLAFWGFVVSIGACIAWYLYHGMGLAAALAVLSLIFLWFLVYARIVSQGGLYVAVNQWSMPAVIHSLSGGHAFNPAGAVIASMQGTLLFGGRTTLVSAQTMNAFRIASVFGKKARLLLPALVVSVLVALVMMTLQVLRQAYTIGAVNFWDSLQTVMPGGAFWSAQGIIVSPAQSVHPHAGALTFGAVTMAALTLLRARFYWWPVHPIGFLACTGFHAQRLWLPFFLGWLTKVGILKLAGGRMLRQARDFFIAVIIAHYFVSGTTGILQLLTGGTFPGL